MYETSVSTEQVNKFNTKFDIYAKVTQQTSADYGYSFIEKGNTASDIITCANSAMSINSTNDYDLQNSVEVEVDIGSDSYHIYPISNQPENRFIKNKTLEASKTTSTFDDINSMDFYDFLKEYSSVRIVDIASTRYSSTAETIYQYYFNVDENGLTYSEVTGKITKIVFKIYTTRNFDDTTLWKNAK
jgi:hypothetical protein